MGYYFLLSIKLFIKMEDVKSEKIIARITNWIAKRGFEDIRANVDGYEAPTGFALKSEETMVTPDITAISYGTKSYFEIATKQDKRKDVQMLVSKWKLLSAMAKHKGGQLYLFAPRGHKQFTQDIIKDYSIEANFLSVDNLPVIS